MSALLTCVSPVDGRVFVERPLADAAEKLRAGDPDPDRARLAGVGVDVWLQLGSRESYGKVVLVP